VDPTDPESILNAKQWLQEIDRYACEDVVKILCVTKADLIPASTLEAKPSPIELIREHADHFEDFFTAIGPFTSAKTAQGVEDLFNLAISETHRKVAAIDRRYELQRADTVVFDTTREKKSKTECCAGRKLVQRVASKDTGVEG
jgi:Ras-related protein Rab-1A